MIQGAFSPLIASPERSYCSAVATTERSGTPPASERSERHRASGGFAERARYFTLALVLFLVGCIRPADLAPPTFQPQQTIDGVTAKVSSVDDIGEYVCVLVTFSSDNPDKVFNSQRYSFAAEDELGNRYKMNDIQGFTLANGKTVERRMSLGIVPKAAKTFKVAIHLPGLKKTFYLIANR